MASWKGTVPWGGVAAGLACAFALAVDGCASDRFEATSAPIDADTDTDADLPDAPSPEAGSSDGGPEGDAGAFCNQQTNFFFCEDFEGSDFPSPSWRASAEGGPGNLAPGRASERALRLTLSDASPRRIGLSRTFELPERASEIRLEVDIRAHGAISVNMTDVVSLHLGGDAGSFRLLANASDPGGGRVSAASGVDFLPGSALPSGVWQTYRFVVNRTQNASSVELLIDGGRMDANAGRRPAIPHVIAGEKTLSLELAGDGPLTVDLDNVVIWMR